jgi:hypothetical protein
LNVSVELASKRELKKCFLLDEFPESSLIKAGQKPVTGNKRCGLYVDTSSPAVIVHIGRTFFFSFLGMG